MNNFIFENATKAYFGKGCVKEYLVCLVKHYGENVMLAYGGGSIRENGIYEEALESLAKAGKNVTEFRGIMENPTYQKALEGARIVREKHIDFILGVGGGSVLDCCKAMSAAAVYEGDLWDDFYVRQGYMEFAPIPVGVVMTAAGSGSEMNGCAVISNEKLKVKMGRDYPQCNPRFALLDPTYTYSVPKRKMVSGGLNALSHIMEIYFSEPDENNVSDEMAEALMQNIIENLRAAIRNPEDYTARSNLMWDAAMAENRVIKLGKRTDFACRYMAHQLGAYTDCDHGETLAVLHPVYYRHICRDGIHKFKRFAVRIWGVSEQGKTDEEIADAGVEALADFIKEMEMPSTLRELGIAKTTDFEAVADSCMISRGSYRPMTHEEIREIFRECY